MRVSEDTEKCPKCGSEDMFIDQWVCVCNACGYEVGDDDDLIGQLTRERDDALAKLSDLQKRIADAPRDTVSQDSDGYTVIWDCGGLRYGTRVALVPITEDGK